MYGLWEEGVSEASPRLQREMGAKASVRNAGPVRAVYILSLFGLRYLAEDTPATSGHS